MSDIGEWSKMNWEDLGGISIASKLEETKAPMKQELKGYIVRDRGEHSLCKQI